MASQVVLTVGGRAFSATLEDNAATRALTVMLPMTVTMSERNGNEKYYYLESSLPARAERVGSIQAGDIMLFGSDCLVVFYQSFSTGYSYTRLGHIDDAAGLADAVGSGDVEVSWQLA